MSDLPSNAELWDETREELRVAKARIEQLEREKAQLLLDMKRISNGTDEVLRPSDKGYIDRRGIRGIARRNLDANLAFLSRIDQALATKESDK